MHVIVTLLHASMEEEGGWREVEGIAAVESACISRVGATMRKGESSFQLNEYILILIVLVENLVIL